MGVSRASAPARHGLPAQRPQHVLRLLWRRRRRQQAREARFRDYLRAMGWTADEHTGVLVGEMAGWPLTAYEDARGRSIIEFRAPAAMSPVLARPRPRGGPIVMEQDGLTVLMTGDPDFDEAYEVRAAEPWFAYLVLGTEVRRGLLAAPPQEWSIEGARLTAIGPHLDDPLDLLARTGSLAAVLESVPWQAYTDTTVPPQRAAVVAAMAGREPRLTHAQATALSQPD
ncbi:MAG: hypothetical protein ABI246_10175 [Candidatus Nanopelagicales bacterium]